MSKNVIAPTVQGCLNSAKPLLFMAAELAAQKGLKAHTHVARNTATLQLRMIAEALLEIDGAASAEVPGT